MNGFATYEHPTFGFSMQHPHKWGITEGSEDVVFFLPTNQPLEHLSIGICWFGRAKTLNERVRESL